MLAAWAYSAEPVRLKRSGWWGPGLVGLCYEGLPWFTGAAVIAQAAPRAEVTITAVLYALGAHGIMTLNDFKALEGDRQLGLRSLPVTMGPEAAARLACIMMTVPQLVVISLLVIWGRPIHAAIILGGVLAQFAAMRVLLRDPKAKAPWYNGTWRCAVRVGDDGRGGRAARSGCAMTLSWLSILRLGWCRCASARSWC